MASTARRQYGATAERLSCSLSACGLRSGYLARLEAVPDDLGEILDCSDELTRAGRHEEHLELVREALARRPGELEIVIRAAEAHLAEAPERAAELAGEAVERAPEDPVTLMRATSVMLYTERLDEARKLFVRAGRSAPRTSLSPAISRTSLDSFTCSRRSRKGRRDVQGRVRRPARDARLRLCSRDRPQRPGRVRACPRGGRGGAGAIVPATKPSRTCASTSTLPCTAWMTFRREYRSHRPRRDPREVRIKEEG